MKPVTFPPSTAHIWGSPSGCPGYVRAVREYPKPSVIEADEGKEAHAHAAAALVDKSRLMHIVDHDMRKHVESYVEAVHHCMAWYNHNDDGRMIEYGIEEKFVIRNIHDRCVGYVDTYHAHVNELHIWDLKYGFGWVEVEENLQLAAYASVLLRLLWSEIANPETYRVVFHIFQPRANHPGGIHRTWETTPARIWEIERQLHDAAALADSDACFVRSGNHCRHCVARLDCAASRASGSAALDYVAQPVFEKYTPEQVGAEVTMLERAAKAIEYRLTAARAELEHHIRSGVQVSGWMLEESRSALYWSDKSSAGQILNNLGFNVMKPAEPMTPTQAIKAGVPADFIATLAKRSITTKIVPFKDAKIRKALNYGPK